MNVVFRADASLSIGTGHVMRCLTLAETLRHQGHHCEFVCRNHSGHLADLVESKGFTCHLLSDSGRADAFSDKCNEIANASDSQQCKGVTSDNYAAWLGVAWQEDASQTLDSIAPLKPDWMVVDHYALDAKWQCALANAVDNIMVIDDLANRRHECALLLDQNLGRVGSDYDGLLPADCERLIGPRYALLRPEFAERREQSLNRRQHPEIKRILISLGGVDRANVTGLVLEALTESALPGETQLDIIMGASTPCLDEIQQQATRLPFMATVNVNVRDMAERMCLADMSIGAAGSTSWERCCLGVPSIMVVLAENQRGIANSLARSGCAYLVDSEQIEIELPQVLSQLVESPDKLENMTNNAKSVCDGLGNMRLAWEMVRIANS